MSFAGRNRPVTIALVSLLLSASLLSVNLVAIPIALAGHANSPDDASSAMTVVQQTIDIDYGNRISIEVIVDSGGGSVDSVRALFRPQGGSTVWSYDYPDFVIEGENILVKFEISTGPGSYYPPGTEFEIEIEVTGTDGAKSLVRSPTIIEYLDPAHDWKRVSGDGFTVVYYGVSRSDVDDLIDKTNSRIPMLRTVLGVRESSDFPIFKAVVFPSVRDATPSFPPVSQTATDQFLFAGFAQPEYRLFVQGQMDPATFVHELAHLYTHEALASSLQTGIPSWLGEGLARFLETGSSSSSNARLRSSVRPDELLSLRYMQTVPGQRGDIFIFYPQAGAFVGYLVEEYGAESMAEYLSLMNRGETLLPGFEQVYGKSLYDVENEWRSRFGADALATPVATSEPYRPTDSSSQGTPVPLVDYGMGATGTPGFTGDSGTTTNTDTVLVPGATPQPAVVNSGAAGVSGGDSPTESGGNSSTDYTVAVLVSIIAIIGGAWLYTSRRSRARKRES